MKRDIAKAFAFVALAAMDFSESLRQIEPRVKPLKENKEPRPEGSAPRALRQYLLPHWRGKGTRKQRKERNAKRV